MSVNSPNSSTWVSTSCDGCGAQEAHPLLTGTDLLHGLQGTFHLVQCPQCGLIRQNPRLPWEALQYYYQQNYSPYRNIIEEETLPRRKMDRRYGMWKRVRAIREIQPSGRLLDVGCGTGVFLGEAQRYGEWELLGVEPNARAASYAKQALGIPILSHRFHDAVLPAESFEVITMWNVLEHLAAPIQDLRRAHRLLRPGGWLVFSIPNVDSPARLLFGRYWMGWDLPRHLYLFPQKSLRRILDDIGFHWVERRCIAGSHASLGLSIQFFLRAQGWDSPIFRAMLTLYYSLPTRLALSPLFWLTDAWSLCSLVTIFVRKPLEESRA